MEFLIDLRFEDKNYSALIHFLATFNAKNEIDAQYFYDELLAAFTRRGVTIFPSTYIRIDNNNELRERSYEYHRFYLTNTKANVHIEQFVLENPDQDKSLWDNLTEKFFAGDKSTAQIGNKYNIPVQVRDKKTRNPITEEFYYFSIEHLIPKE